jgi:hypothetical protein
MLQRSTKAQTQLRIGPAELQASASAAAAVAGQGRPAQPPTPLCCNRYSYIHLLESSTCWTRHWTGHCSAAGPQSFKAWHAVLLPGIWV